MLLSACTHEAQTYPAPTPKNTSCDTVSMSYKKDIQPTIKICCYNCHSDSASQNGVIAIDLEDFTKLKNYLSQGFRGDGIYGSKFVHCIEKSQYIIGMPPDYKLDTCSLGKIRSWIRDGANDN